MHIRRAWEKPHNSDRNAYYRAEKKKLQIRVQLLLLSAVAGWMSIAGAKKRNVHKQNDEFSSNCAGQRTSSEEAAGSCECRAGCCTGRKVEDRRGTVDVDAEGV